MELAHEDKNRLEYALELLENPGLAAKMTNVMGVPIEKAFSYLPAKWSGSIQKITHQSLTHALDIAVKTIDPEEKKASRDIFHKCLAVVSGGIGGAFGLPALAMELPVTTVIMLRSIADNARSEGEDIRQIETKLACLTVFALGGTSEKDNFAESGYYAVRSLLAKQVSEAARYIVEKGVAEQGAPALVRLIGAIASRFGVTVSQKAAATAVPVIGAAGGALINSIFMDHFQNMARGHFIMRSLERKYGYDVIRRKYDDGSGLMIVSGGN